MRDIGIHVRNGTSLIKIYCFRVKYFMKQIDRRVCIVTKIKIYGKVKFKYYE